jgi:hypothetical protein
VTPAETIERLYSLGHFHNPKYPTGVTKAHLPTLRLHDKEVRMAIQSYVDFMTGDNDADPDNPESLELIAEPRCGYPDFPYPEGIQAAQMEANWPTTCRGKLRFGRNFRSLPGMSESDTDKVFIAMCNNWSYALEDVEIVLGAYQDAHIYAGLKSLGGSTLAWSFLARNSCSERLEQAYDSGRNWTLSLGCPVASHEVGHALGLPHNNDRDALMYPSIHDRSIARRGYPNATDLNQAKGLGYKLSGKAAPTLEDIYRPRPHTPVPPVDPTDPLPPGQLWFKGSFTAMIGDKEVGEYILTPKPQA